MTLQANAGQGLQNPATQGPREDADRRWAPGSEDPSRPRPDRRQRASANNRQQLAGGQATATESATGARHRAKRTRIAFQGIF